MLEREADLDDPPPTWPVFEEVVNGLWNEYSKFLGIRVKDKDRDYLVWEALDVRSTYGSAVPPDCEHYGVALLALEGVVSEATTANWDGLVEAAIDDLGANSDQMVRVVVLPDELREAERPLTLLKFHGCAIRAIQDPDRYRAAIVATRHQITKWNDDPAVKPIHDRMVSLATTKPTLMIGLSAQDENIQRIFARAESEMAWVWRTDPPAHMFANDRLGEDHINILEVVYGAPRITRTRMRYNAPR